MMAFLPPTARANTTTFYLSGVGSGQSLAGVYTSPYSGSVNGTNGPTISVICDDFADESFVPEQWTANVTQLSTLAPPDNQLKFAGAWATTFTVGGDIYNGWSLNQSQAYTVAAVLAIDILQSTGTAQQDYSYALWELFDPTGVISQLGSYQTNLMTASSDLEHAITQMTTNGLTPANFSNVTIYSYAGGATCPSEPNGVCLQTPPQEFIVVTPEPASMILFGTGILGIAFLMRRRLFV